ncbi:MAG: helix-hairpin-helix domain-containing protein [Candidatus Berkelbacteria bacterium]|nr:helix-hairpin-helix domain-containing protein [Candidatus Berkelbacteria bacterium]
MILDFIYKKRTLIGGLLILIILIGVGIILYSVNKNKEGIKTTSNETEITIDIEGAVKNPGVYKLKNGSIIQDAINVAGGFNETADNELASKDINRAEILKNNQKILIPFKTQIQATPQTAGETTSIKININTASLEQLDSLPGIGPVYAQRIFDYRKKKPFSSIEEIMEIQGIGEKTFEKMKDQITI